MLPTVTASGLRRLVLFVLVGTYACAGGAARPTGTLRRQTPAERQARLTLGAAELTEDPGAIAELEWRLGNRELAVEAARLALDRVRAHRWLIGEPANGPAVVSLALRIGDAAPSPQLVIDALDPPPGPGDPHAEIFLRAALRKRLFLDREVAAYEAAWKLAAGDPAARADLERALVAEGASRLDDAALTALGPRAADLAGDRFQAARRAGAVPAIRAAAERLLAVDPLDLRALIALVALDVGLPPGVELSDVTGAGGAMILGRLERARRAAPWSPPLALGLALQLDAVGAFGDVTVLLAELGRHGPLPPHAQTAAGVLGARAAFQGGDVALAAAWAKRAGAQGSVSWARFLGDGEDTWPLPAQRAAGAAARRLALARGFGLSTWTRGEWSVRQALDARVAAAERARATSVLAWLDPDAHRIVSGCAVEALALDACRERVARARALFLALDQDDDEALRAQGVHLPELLLGADASGNWLYSVTQSLDAASLRALAPTLDCLAGTRLGSSDGFAQARLYVDVARGDAAALTAHLGAEGRLLPPRMRVVFQLAARDLRAGRDARDRLRERLWPLPRAATLVRWRTLATAPVELDEFLAGGGEVAALERALVLLRGGDLAGGADLLEPLAAELGGAEAAELWARVAIAALVTGDPARLGRAAARVHALAPQSEADLVVRARVAEATGAHGEALALWQRLTLLGPPNADVADAFVGALARTAGPGDPTRALAVARRTFPHLGDLFDRLARRGRLGSGDALLTLWLALDDPELAYGLGAAGATEPHTAGPALRYLEGRVVDAPPGEVRARAVEAAAYAALAAPVQPAGGESLAWFYFLAGAEAKALAALRAHDAEAAPYHPIARLAGARARLSDELAHDVFVLATSLRGEPAALARRLLAAAPEHAGVAAQACRWLVDGEARAEALVPCKRGWDAGTADLDLAVAASFVVLDDRGAARKLGWSAAALFAEAERRLPASGGTWRHNFAVWLRGEGRTPEAAAMEADAWAFGFEPGVADGLASESYPELLHRGPALRWQAVRGAEPSRLRSTWSTLAFLALYGGDVAPARAYMTAVNRLAGQADADEVGTWPLTVADLIALAEADLADKALDAAGILLVMSSLEAGELRAAEEAHQRYPRAALVEVWWLEAVRNTPTQRGDAITRGRALAARFPDNLSVGIDLLDLLVTDGRYRDGRAELTRLEQRHRGDARLAAVRVPDGPDGARLVVPAGLETAAAAAARLAAVDEATLAALAPTRQVDLESSTEVFLPAAWSRAPDKARHSDGTANLVPFAFPRAELCEADACVSPLITELEQAGWQLLWRRRVELGAGPGGEALMVLNGVAVDIVIVPAGGRLYGYMLGAPAEALATYVGVMALAQRGFAPLDHVVGAVQAERLRGLTGSAPDDQRLAARHALIAPPGSAATKVGPAAPACPLDKALTAAGARRTALLVDVYLSAVPAARARLVACAPGDDPAAATLGMLAVLDEDFTLRAWGLAAVQRHGAEALAAAKVLVMGERATAMAGQDRDGRDLAPYGALEVLLALPPAQRRELAEAFLVSKVPGERAVAFGIVALAPDALDLGKFVDVIVAGSPDDGWTAANSLQRADRPVRLGPALLDKVRARFDALVPGDRVQLGLFASLRDLISAQLDPADRARLDGAAARVRALTLAGVPAGERPRVSAFREFVGAGCERAAKAHAHALALVADPRRKPHAEARVEREARMHLLVHVPWRGKAKPAHELVRTPLARLLPGEEWTFVRLEQPGLFVAGVRALYQRLVGPSDADTVLARKAFGALVERAGGSIFADAGGLDLSRPIECAEPAHEAPGGFLCTAFVKDAQALRRQLAARTAGSDAGVGVPLAVARAATGVAIAATAAPLMLATMLEPERSLGGRIGGARTEERVRTTLEVAGIRFEYYAITRLSDDEAISVDREVYLIDGDRVLVVTNPLLARYVLERAPAKGAALADSARFRRVTASWRRGAAVQTVTLSPASKRRADTGYEVVAGEEGLSLRFVLPAPQGARSVEPAWSRLPAGAIARFAASGQEMERVMGDDDDADDAAAAAPGAAPPGAAGADAAPAEVALEPPLAGAPPRWIWSLEHTVTALGWYPGGERLWSRWVIVLDPDAADRRVMADKLGGLPAEGDVRPHGEAFLGARGAFLVLGAPKELVEQALAQGPEARAPGARLVIGRGRLDGLGTMPALRVLAKGFRDADPRATLLAGVAIFVGAAREVAFEAVVEGGREELRVHITPNLAPAGTDLSLIDQWLAGSAIRNSARLPRAIKHEDLGGSMSLVLETRGDAQTLAAAEFPPSPRLRVTVVDDRHLRLDVTAGATPAQPVPPVPLSAAERRGTTEPDRALEVRTLADELGLPGLPPAEAARRVVAWLKRNVKYEITPASLEAAAILARGRGDCTEYSTLAVALLRSAGVPAELRSGMATDGTQLVAHAWVAYHDGVGWRELEPTWGYDFVDAGHLETDVARFVALFSLGEIQIVGVEAAPARP